jgi:hypothetical protein
VTDILPSVIVSVLPAEIDPWNPGSSQTPFNRLKPGGCAKPTEKRVSSLVTHFSAFTDETKHENAEASAKPKTNPKLLQIRISIELAPR